MNNIYPFIHFAMDLGMLFLLYLIFDTASVGNDIAERSNRRANQQGDLKRELDQEFEALYEKSRG